MCIRVRPRFTVALSIPSGILHLDSVPTGSTTINAFNSFRDSTNRNSPCPQCETRNFQFLQGFYTLLSVTELPPEVNFQFLQGFYAQSTSAFSRSPRRSSFNSFRDSTPSLRITPLLNNNAFNSFRDSTLKWMLEKYDRWVIFQFLQGFYP